jgi:hypothetical protein
MPRATDRRAAPQAWSAVQPGSTAPMAARQCRRCWEKPDIFRRRHPGEPPPGRLAQQTAEPQDSTACTDRWECHSDAAAAGVREAMLLVTLSLILFAFVGVPQGNAGELSARTASVRSTAVAEHDVTVGQTSSAAIPFPHTEHVTVQGIECLQCHDSHSGNFLPPPSACQGCHAGMGFPHSVHFSEQAIVCLTCHDAHGPDPMPCGGCHGAGVLPTPHYLPTASDCLDCHG